MAELSLENTSFCEYYQIPELDSWIKKSKTQEKFIKLVQTRGSEWASVTVLSDSKELAQTLNHEIAENEFLNLKVAFTYEEPENTQQSQLICKTYISVYDDHNAYPIKEFGGVVTGIISFAELKNEKLFSQYLVKFLAQNLRINAEPILKLAEDFKKMMSTLYGNSQKQFFKSFAINSLKNLK